MPPQISPPVSATDPKRPYGGLVPSQPKGTRAYHDAAAYNQHLAQHQAYTAQAQAASQAAQNVYRNPYLTAQSSQQGSTTNAAFPSREPAGSNYASHRSLNHQTSHGHLGTSAGAPAVANPPAYQGHNFPVTSSTHLTPTAPTNSYQTGTTRTRSNTINHMMDNVPPALARLQHMNQDVIGGRKALTPVLKRDDAMREWERRQSGKAAAAQPYPQLEYLQQQAELAATQGMGNWGYTHNAHAGPSNRYPVPPTSNLAHSYTSTMVVDDDRRDAVMSNVRSAARGDSTGPQNLYGSNVISSPPQAYSSNSTTTGNRYAATYSQQQTPTSPFDSVDRRTDIGTLYVPMQPDQYGSYSSTAQASQNAAARQVAPPAQAVPPSFYGAGVVPAGPSTSNQQRNPFSGADGSVASQGSMSTKESRRKSGMDMWTQ